MSAGCDPPSARAPRLWLPGLLYLSERGETWLGRTAGYAGEGKPFSRLRCGRRAGIEHWTHTAWLCARSALSRTLVDAHGIILPESLIDREALPHAHRWLREQPLVCVSGLGSERLAEAGVRVYRVALDATGEQVLALEATGGQGRDSAVRVPLATLQHPADGAVLERRSTIDRLLRACTKGVLDEQAVVNAFDVRSLVEDGYGYRGALEGKFSPLECLERALRPLDVLFGQIFERAAGTRELGEQLIAALGRVPAEALETEVPLFGKMRRSIEAPLRLRLVEPGMLEGEPVSELGLPAESHWRAECMASWEPELPADLELDDGRAARPSAGGTGRWLWLALGLALLLGLAWLAVRAR